MNGKETPHTESDRIAFNRRTAMKGMGLAGLALGFGGMATGTVAAESNGSNKAGAAGYDLTNVTLGEDGKTLLSTSIKTSTHADLIVQLSSEISLITDINVKSTGGNKDISTAKASAACWLEIDGVPVNPNPTAPVISAEEMDEATYQERVDAAKVYLNNRDFEAHLTNNNEYEIDLALFLGTKSAHGFNWYVPDVSRYSDNDVHEVVVMAEVVTHTDDGQAKAEAAFGPRTLVVEPTNMSYAGE